MPCCSCYSACLPLEFLFWSEPARHLSHLSVACAICLLLVCLVLMACVTAGAANWLFAGGFVALLFLLPCLLAARLLVKVGPARQSGHMSVTCAICGPRDCTVVCPDLRALVMNRTVHKRCRHSLFIDRAVHKRARRCLLTVRLTNGVGTHCKTQTPKPNAKFTAQT